MLTKSQLAVWTADLRANADKQGTKQLHLGDKFCCLGRLCHLMKDELGLEVETDEYGTTSYDRDPLVLPSKLSILFGIGPPGAVDSLLPGAEEYVHARNEAKGSTPGRQPRTLASMNDNGWTFVEIADFLDKFYPAVDDPKPEQE